MLSEPVDAARDVVEFGVERWVSRSVLDPTRIRWVSFTAGAHLPTAEAEAIDRAAWFNRIVSGCDAVVVKRHVSYGNWEKA